MYIFITCSAVILYADWSIGVRSGTVFTLCRFNLERQNSISNSRIQYYHLVTSLVLRSKVTLRFSEMYLLFSLSMKEQVIHLLRLVGNCNSTCYPPSVIKITLGSTSWDRLTLVGYQAGLHFPTKLD